MNIRSNPGPLTVKHAQETSPEIHASDVLSFESVFRVLSLKFFYFPFQKIYQCMQFNCMSLFLQTNKYLSTSSTFFSSEKLSYSLCMTDNTFFYSVTHCKSVLLEHNTVLLAEKMSYSQKYNFNNL